MTKWRIRRRLTGLRINSRPVDCLAIAESMSRHLRSGSSLTASLGAAGRSHPQEWVFTVLRSVTSGDSLADAVTARLARETDERRPHGDVVLALQVIGLAARVGGEPTRHIDALVETLRSRRHAAADRLTQASTAIASIRLLTWLPLVCAVWMVLDDSAVREVLFASPIGWACLISGVVFNLLGRQWTNRLVRRA